MLSTLFLLLAIIVKDIFQGFDIFWCHRLLMPMLYSAESVPDAVSETMVVFAKSATSEGI